MGPRARIATLLLSGGLALAIGTPAPALGAVGTSQPVASAAQRAIAPPSWRPGIRSARRFAARRRGRIEFAVRTPKRAWCVRCGHTVYTQSTVKVMLMLADMRRRIVRSHRLSGWRRAQYAVMIRRSDNVAARQIFNRVGRSGLQRVARLAHMKRFQARDPWYASRVTAAGGARLMLYVDRLLPARHRRYGMTLLRTIIHSQRWGVGSVKPRCWALYFKGGWGNASGADDHQFALLRRGRMRVALAITVTNSPSHHYGTVTLRGVARRLIANLPREKGCRRFVRR